MFSGPHTCFDPASGRVRMTVKDGLPVTDFAAKQGWAIFEGECLDSETEYVDVVTGLKALRPERLDPVRVGDSLTFPGLPPETQVEVQTPDGELIAWTLAESATADFADPGVYVVTVLPPFPFHDVRKLPVEVL